MKPTDGVLVPLADRIRWTTAARAATVLLPLGIWFAWPDLRATDLVPLLIGAGVVLGGSVAAIPLLRLGRRQALLAVGLTLLLDGTYLAGAFLALGGFAGPIGYVFLLHAMAVTLLTSFRTGLKVVLWHSIVLLVAIEAQMSGLLQGPLTGKAFPADDFALLLALLWTATLGTATFAAANERELRRRRRDADVLRRLAMDLEQASDVEAVAAALVEVAHAELDARRAVVVACAGALATDHGLECAPGSRPTIRIAPGTLPSDVEASAPSSMGATVQRALAHRQTLLVESLDPDGDAWLSMLLPDATNLVLVPFVIDAQVIGALVLEQGPASRGRRLLRREARIERRRISTAEQATAHAAQAFGRAALVARLRSSADTDGLTGIANRRAFDRGLEAELARTIRIGLPTTILLVDVDRFKAVNDTYGHQAGDDVLRTIGDVLQGSSRTGDIAARYGGEEFGVILSTTGADGARAVAERVRREVAERTLPHVTISIGVATTFDGLTDPAGLLRRADEALYHAKHAGRDRVVSAEQVTLSRVGLGDVRT